MIKSRQIPTADSDLLREALRLLHESVHTPEGLHAFDGPRRQLVDTSMKAIAVASELVRRGAIPTPCSHCLPDVWAVRLGLDPTSARSGT